MAGKPKMPDGSAVGAQLVSRHLFRREALLAEQLAHQPDGCALVPSALNQDLEDLALMIDRAPQIHMLAGDANHHLVEGPAVARPRTRASEPAGKPGPEFHNPAPHRVVGNLR